MSSTGQHRAGRYQRVFDERKRPIRGLWKRGDRYYAQITLEDETTGLKSVKRVPLEGARTPSHAREKLEEIRVGRRKGELPVLRMTPKFVDYAKAYLEFYSTVKDAKRESTMETEGYAIDRWIEHLGHVRLDKITPALVNSFVAKRQASGISARTVNLEMTVLRNVLKRAFFDDKWITRMPTAHVRPLKRQMKVRQLVTSAELDRLCGEALRKTEHGPVYLNGEEFAAYIRVMAYAGSRMSETLTLRWDDVDWQARQLTIGASGRTKNNQVRWVDFNANLEAHLRAMSAQKAPDSEWLFPSPRRGETDRPAKTFRETLLLVRAKAGLPKFGFHDCRHHFISMCVMAGIDYMTIARWAGHQDGGILIGKVYGHLSNEHAQTQAGRLTFGPVLVNKASNQ